ncbi:uncharacterized protein LOC113391058 [Ctenocephalides felis]|uniref:uncharacterized protein LOC113391058 n=1 Tax=Ctenocephalides felis TaxID=7515 RepID=UPI000E6E1094|nr:uncharacterized protein LOC113391058 [Ctenocephalides felis]
MNSNIFCQECQVSFAHRASLFRHMRRKHGENPRLVYPNACSLCEKTFKNKRSLTRHITQVHANIPPTSSTLSLVRSKSLPSSTTSAVSLIQHSTHLFSPKSSGSPSNSSTQVTCHPSSIPKSPLSSKVNINSDPSTSAPLGTRPHMALLPQPSNSSRQVTFHPSPIPNCPLSLKENFTGTPSRNKRIICPFPECYLVFSRYNNFYNHFESHHNTIIDYEEVVFQTLNDFVLWKSDVEQKENSHYIQGNSGYTTSKNCKTKYYNCHRSYTYEQQNTIRTSTKNTIKTGYACPSRIACTVDGNHAVKVRFWKTHIGHTKQINKSISLDKHSKENIKMK